MVHGASPKMFVGVSKQIRVDVLVAKRQFGEVLDQVFEQGIRQPLLVRPLGIAEHAVKGIGVCFLDLPHRALEGTTDIARLGANVIPVAVFRDLEAVRLRKPGQLFVAGFIDDLLVLLVPDVADALEEQQREDVGLEVSRIHRAAQDIGGLPEVTFELAEGDLLVAQTRAPSSLPANGSLFFCLAYIGYSKRLDCLTM